MDFMIGLATIYAFSHAPSKGKIPENALINLKGSFPPANKLRSRKQTRTR